MLLDGPDRHSLRLRRGLLADDIFYPEAKFGETLCLDVIPGATDIRLRDKPLATFFSPTFNMALSKALPIKNSRERSTGFVSFRTWIAILTITVNSFLIGKGLPLLSFVPVDDQAIAEGQCSSGVGGSGRHQWTGRHCRVHVRTVRRS